MTQTSPKPTPQNDTNGYSQYAKNGVVESEVSATAHPLAANLISPPQQTVQDAEATKPLELEGVHRVQRQGILRRRWQKLSLRTKATALAIAIGTLPVLVIGASAYYFADRAIVKQISQAKQARAVDLADKINRFMFDRYGDIQIISSLPIFRNRKIQAITPLREKQATLNRFLDAYMVYDSIAVFDLNGNVIVESLGKPLSNPRNRDYFQQVIKTDLPVISSPEESTGEVVIHFAAPVKDQVTGKTIAVVRARMPINRLEEVVNKFGNKEDEYILSDASGKIFLAFYKGYLGKDARTILPELSQLQQTKRPANRIMIDQVDKDELLVGYSPTEKLAGLPSLNWDTIVATETKTAFAPQRQLLLTLTLGTGVTAFLVGAIAAYLANRATRPILAATGAVKKLGLGEFDTRIGVAGEDEFAVLGSNINRMAVQIQTLLAEQEKANRQQLAVQEQIARQQVENAQQQRIAKEQLQARALELLMEVEPISKGDLTIRANVTADEIGTIADSYNATVASLRKIVTQVQTAATQVAATTSSNEVSVQELSNEAMRQTQGITAALDRIQEMSNSIHAVVTSAQQAEAAVQQATTTVQAGEVAMNRTVEGIVTIRETVAETSKKVQRLGESSQKISKVVNLIGTFAAQTNLLALKASIEAARAGEEGRGFAVLAEEVRSLARQSQAATAEIESLVAAIQTETNSVIAAMEAGTQQVAQGTLLVDETRISLNKITAVSAEIGELVNAIASSAVAQSQTSFAVTQTMTDVAAIAANTSTEATVVSDSFKELLAVATELQASVGQFKVRSEEVGR